MSVRASASASAHVCVSAWLLYCTRAVESLCGTPKLHTGTASPHSYKSSLSKRPAEHRPSLTLKAVDSSRALYLTSEIRRLLHFQDQAP